jgi:hypothetical protein
MEKLLARAQELVTELQAKIAKVNAQQSEVNKQAAQNKADNEELKNFAVSLAAREVEVKKVEDLQKLYKDAKEAKAAAELQRTKLAGEAEAFKQDVANAKAELSIEKGKVANDRALQRKEYEQLRADQKKLAEDRANLKESVMAEIKARVGA